MRRGTKEGEGNTIGRSIGEIRLYGSERRIREKEIL